MRAAQQATREAERQFPVRSGSQSSERGRKLLDQLELQLESGRRGRGRSRRGTGRWHDGKRVPPQKAGAGALSGASAARACGGPSTEGLPLLRRQARQARLDALYARIERRKLTNDFPRPIAATVGDENDFAKRRMRY